MTTNKFNYFSRDLLKQFTTNELMSWSLLKTTYERELRDGTADSPATGVFDKLTERGQKHWEDFRKRVVQHVSKRITNLLLLVDFQRYFRLFFCCLHLERKYIETTED